MLPHGMNLAILTLAFTSTVHFVDGTRVRHGDRSVEAAQPSNAATQFGSSAVHLSFGGLLRDLCLVSLLALSVESVAPRGGQAHSTYLKSMESKLSPLTTDIQMANVIKEAKEAYKAVGDMIDGIVQEFKDDNEGPQSVYHLGTQPYPTTSLVEDVVNEGIIKSGTRASEIVKQHLQNPPLELTKFLSHVPTEHWKEFKDILLAENFHEKKKVAGEALDQYARNHREIVKKEGTKKYVEFKILSWNRADKKLHVGPFGISLGASGDVSRNSGFELFVSPDSIVD